MPQTSTMSPTRYCAKASVCEAMSPSVPEPATARSWRQVNGKPGSAWRSWSKVPRNSVISPSSPALDQLARVGVRRVLEVVEADQRRHARGPRGVCHLPGLGRAVGERLLAVDRLAGGERGERHLAMHVVGRGDVDHVDRGVAHQVPPVGAPAGEAQVVRGGARPVGVDVGDHLEPGHRGLGAEHHRHVAVRHAVRLAHPAGADQPDPDLAHRRCSPAPACPAPACQTLRAV